MALGDKQKSAALEWARNNPKIQKQLWEIKYDLFYRPLVQFGGATLALILRGLRCGGERSRLHQRGGLRYSVFLHL
ncbi:hypothetical protein [Acetobacter sp.]|uniref:hypothetical protein n=1 Tax=Acetobacter sp. TaxID=440 RepID=UPI0039E83312